MMRPKDPRVRQRINQISHNLESANETAQEGLYTFSQNYVLPCFATVGNCVYSCTAPCLPSREDHLRRRRRGRAEAIFDFYDDWDNDDSDNSILGWGTDELDRLLAGSGLARGTAEQPRRQRQMSYGTRRTRRKSSVLAPDDRNDPTVIPSSSFLGFLERFPWRFGARGIKYRPSAADLQEHPTAMRRHSYENENEPLIEEPEDLDGPSSNGKNRRYRSSTQSSRETSNSLSSRGDLFPSDEEEDAVPLDDEFAMALGSRRGTGLLESEDPFGDKPSSTRSTSGTFSLASKASKKEKKKQQRRSSRNPNVGVTQDIMTPSMVDLHKEEARLEHEEESEIIRKRLAARQLASTRGLKSTDQPVTFSLPSRSPTVSSEVIEPEPESSAEMGESDVSLGPASQPNSRTSEEYPRMEPFPPFPVTPPPADDYEDQTNPSNPSNSAKGAQ